MEDRKQSTATGLEEMVKRMIERINKIEELIEELSRNDSRILDIILKLKRGEL